LLDVSRIRSGILVLDRQPVDLIPLLHAAAAVVQGVESTGRVQVQAPASLRIVIDPLRIEQVLINLLDNAVKYSAADTPIEVVAARTADGFVEIRVRDYGEGIPVQERRDIFERFARARPHEHHRGMGLGLYVSRQIVELHGGQITAEFPEDGGTRFVIRLPVEASA
jgi:signal transduction histidine kinase